VSSGERRDRSGDRTRGCARGSALPTRHPSPTGRGGFRPDIEGLRALAILPVLAYHATNLLNQGASAGLLAPLTATFGRVTGGFLGVDVFFVISGYLITGLLVDEAATDGRIPFGRFYARRARRILPAATVTLLAALVWS
jgi:peptidoglycan/LPS O-acetylase OafA/YrhL